MSEVDNEPQEAPRELPNRRQDHGLRDCFSRHRALESVWSAVALFGLSSEDHYVATAARALGVEIKGLTGLDASQRDPLVLRKIHECIDSLETELRSIVREINLEQMRAILPARAREDRDSVLNLLNLMLGAEVATDGGGEGRVATLDYVITVLCTDGGRSNSIQDPLTLSPQLFKLCEMASELDDPRIAQIASEFLLAADNAKSVNLSQQKAGLGELLFVPDILRTLVAYNAALWDDDNHSDTEIQDAADKDSGGDIGDSTTIFVTSALPRLGAALRRRSEGGEQTTSSIDRVAWHLDLDLPTPDERARLLSPEVGRPSELAGTAIMVGLLSRSATVVAEELEVIGISADQVTCEWARELNDLLKKESARLIVENQYDDACVLSDLRTKYLTSSTSGGEAPDRPAKTEPGLKQELRKVRAQATELASEAAVMNTSQPQQQPSEAASMRRQLMKHAASIVVAIGAIAAMMISIFVVDDGLQRLGKEQLAAVSPYLESGRMNATAESASFVGVVHADWGQVESSVQEVLAEEMVEVLRIQGVRQIMIYDGDGALQIQALGDRSVHVTSDAALAGNRP